MKIIIGIDPGPTQTAYAIIDGRYGVVEADKIPNKDFIDMLVYLPFRNDPTGNIAHAAIESIQSYGMPVGKETFETCYMIGRIMECFDRNDTPYTLYPRPVYAKSICGVGKISDSVLRQALLLRFGGDKKGEPMYPLKGCSDKRSAFAVAAYHLDLNPSVSRR